LTCAPVTPKEHFGQSFYRQLVKIDQRLQSRTSVSIAELGFKLGVRVQGSYTSTAWNEPCTSSLVAPVAVRLASVIWDTQESRLLVTVDRGSRVTPKAIGVAPFDLHGPRLDPKRPQSKAGRRPNFTWSLPSQPGPQSVVRLSIGDTPIYERLIEGLSETVLGRSLFDDPPVRLDGIGRRWFKRSALPSGGQADVWIVEDDKGNRGVLKVPRTDRADPRRLERFRREASTLKRPQGRSPFVVKLLDSSRDSATAPAHVTELAALGFFETNVQLFHGDAWRSLRLATASLRILAHRCLRARSDDLRSSQGIRSAGGALCRTSKARSMESWHASGPSRGPPTRSGSVPEVHLAC
jgi:hypothetical protein